MEARPKWVWKVVVVMISVLWFSSCSQIHGCWEDERIALLHFKPIFNVLNYVNWVEEKGSNCCEWIGVECNSTTKRIISLSLNYGRDLTMGSKVRSPWYLNASLFLPFEELKVLHLVGNNLAGFVENEGFAKLSSLVNLEFLDLSYNYLNDSMLLSLTELSSLKYLDLSTNQFTGSSHHANDFKQLSRLSNLETLHLGWNHLKNSILPYLGSLSSLKNLYLQANKFEGMLHLQELNNLTNLKTLDLSFNRIERLLSKHPGNETQLRLTNLEELNLNHNLFRNNTFAFPRGLSSLKSLDMSQNKLQGSIYIDDLSVFTNLEELRMSYNELKRFVAHKGSKSTLTRLSDMIEAFPSIKILDLSGNYYFNMSVVATPELRVSSNVEELYLNESPTLNSNILQILGAFSSLKVLSLSGSTLFGNLPNQGWCDLRNLEELYIDYTGLEGNLPSCLGNLTSLLVLDISGNHLTGKLTPLANLRQLWFLSLSQNQFQVPLSFISLTNLTNLKSLLSDNNKLVMEPVVYTSIPRIQLKVISLTQCTTDQQFSKETAKFFYFQHDLRYVDLSNSNFSGIAPLWLLEKNTKLEVLFLTGNSFTGPLLLPPLPHLILYSLDISYNKIQGQIPKSICSTFPSLEFLSLSNNSFEGTVPPCFGGMRVLLILDISSNQLSGGLPKELTMITSLWILRLSNNNLGGKIASTIFMSNGLFYLYLDGNNFVGEIPEIDVLGVDFAMSLYDIDLSHNSLTGKIPRWIWNLSNLGRLDLSNNYFEGFIPTELCKFVGLEFLDLSGNKLSGSIPSCFNPPLLKHVHLSRNRLNGSLTCAFYNSSSLVTLDIRGNHLTGHIPECIGTISTLSVLLLKANHLEGEIPDQLCRLNSLSIIDLSQNMFSGPIPSCLGNLNLSPESNKSVVYFGSFKVSKGFSQYTGMELKGEHTLDSFHIIPGAYIEEGVEFTTKSGFYRYKGKILMYMSGIDLSCNNFTGQIPAELGMLSKILALNLSHNNLMGVIPSSFSNLKQIESLDLSYNSLSGKIPNELVDLNNLEVFSLAHNNLSGNTPERKAQFGTFDESSYEGNPFLCGPQLNKSCFKIDLPPVPPTTSDEEGEDSFLDMYVFWVCFLVVYVAVLLVIFAILYINPYWRQLWFSFIEDLIDTCRYSAVGNFIELHIPKICA